MSLPRSSSAPHPIFAPFEPQHPLRQSGRSQASLSQSNRRPLRVQTAASAAAPASRPKIPRSTTQPYTPRVEKEDPFNLGGFYSSVLGSPEQDRQWAWLRGTEEEEDKEEEEDEEQLESELNTPEMTVGRDMVVIENEDKLGVLSLGRRSSFDSQSSAQILTPFFLQTPCSLLDLVQAQLQTTSA